MVLITLATSEGSGEPAHPRSLARAFAVRTHDVWKYSKGPTKNQTFSPTGWLRMRVWRMSLRRSKSAIVSWAGSFYRWRCSENGIVIHGGQILRTWVRYCNWCNTWGYTDQKKKKKKTLTFSVAENHKYKHMKPNVYFSCITTVIWSMDLYQCTEQP